jgi:hypothetical protein
LALSPASALTKTELKKNFETKQDDFKTKVVYAFSDSLRNVFYTSSALMLAATIGATFIREKPLTGGHDDSPGVA